MNSPHGIQITPNKYMVKCNPMALLNVGIYFNTRTPLRDKTTLDSVIPNSFTFSGITSAVTVNDRVDTPSDWTNTI